MSGSQNKNLFFYTRYPDTTGQLSALCIQELEKRPALKKQFLFICIHDPSDYRRPNPHVKIPQLVQQLASKLPIIAVAGFPKPVFAQEAYSWLKETPLNQGESSIGGFGGIADSCSTISQASSGRNELCGTDYNMGFSTGQGEFSKSWANIDEAMQSRIVTYAEDGDKSKAGQDTSSRLEQLKMSRNTDMPKQMPQMPQMQQQMPQMPQMMPQQMPQMMPQQMPQMPQMMPQMPQMMPQMQQMPQMPQRVSWQQR